MSRIYHRLYCTRLAQGAFRDALRPVFINNWEATYFNFDEDKLVHLVAVAHQAGMDLLVMDDGWFGRRNDDKSSLGDWVVNSKKLPNGGTGLVNRVNNEKLQFGIWFEPELISPDSDLYRAAIVPAPCGIWCKCKSEDRGCDDYRSCG